jgi:hypothetical protein
VCIHSFLRDATDDIINLFAWLPGEDVGAAVDEPMVVPLRARNHFVPLLKCIIITTGSFAADLAKDYGPLSRMNMVTAIFLDEAQGFGKWLEAIILAKLRNGGFLHLLGDPEQPGGASHEELQKLLLAILEEKAPGFRHPSLLLAVATRLLPSLLKVMSEGKAAGAIAVAPQMVEITKEKNPSSVQKLDCPV